MGKVVVTAGHRASGRDVASAERSGVGTSPTLTIVPFLGPSIFSHAIDSHVLDALLCGNRGGKEVALAGRVNLNWPRVR